MSSKISTVILVKTKEMFNEPRLGLQQSNLFSLVYDLNNIMVAEGPLIALNKAFIKN